ncbi:hypothetical protein O181_128402 [Austropuccinia psidii MF-1]|uniref:Uncharacterized protein n=1 Tax=Austropuccinia psidii MF-1 TaxID=1389203 RepID=A0A9Q3KX72_9BASI|nr:hypothetical protein [Austropuccinia psidii MF-1]
MGPRHVGEVWSMSHFSGPMEHQKPQNIWAQGAFLSWGTPIAPRAWSPWNVDHKTPKSQKNPNRSKNGLDPIFSRMAIVMARTQFHKEGPKWPQGHFFTDNGDKTPPLISLKAQ